MDLNTVISDYQENLDAVNAWCNKIYCNGFEEYFKEARALFEKLQSDDKQITDSELSWILITLPLKLFDVSEAVSRIKTEYEVIKLSNKQIELQYTNESNEKTVSKKKEDASNRMLSNKILALAYSYVITRVESEISFCRELIMGSKKIWDSRKATEQTMPVFEVSDDDVPKSGLPSYTMTLFDNKETTDTSDPMIRGKQYIKG